MTAEDKAKNAGKVALVLEGGSFRGQFTAGVLDVLMEAGVEIPAVYGVSAGALNGVNYKSHQIGRVNRINLTFCNDNRYMGAASFASTGSIVGYDFIFNDIQDRLDPFDNETFDASPIEMYAVATDMLFGTAAYLPVKSAVLDLDAVRASTSLPLVTPPVEIDGHKYVDGRRSRFGSYRACAGGGRLRARGCHCHAGPLVREKALRVYACRARPLCRLPLPARGYRDAPRPLQHTAHAPMEV